MKKLLTAFALIAGATLTATAPAEAAATHCRVVAYGYNFSQADCFRGSYGAWFHIRIPCERDAWWSNHRVTAQGNLGRVGYGGDRSHSHAQCPSGYKRIGGGTIHAQS